jgi:hypothetical protein
MVQSIKRSRKWRFPVTRKTGMQNDHLVTWLVKWISLGVNQEFWWMSGRGTDPSVLAWYRVSFFTVLVPDKKKRALVIGRLPYLSAGKQHSREPQEITVLVSPGHCSNRGNTLVYESREANTRTGVPPWIIQQRGLKIRRIIRHVCTS